MWKIQSSSIKKQPAYNCLWKPMSDDECRVRQIVQQRNSCSSQMILALQDVEVLRLQMSCQILVKTLSEIGNQALQAGLLYSFSFH